MGLETMSRENQEEPNAMVLPPRDQFVDRPMKGLSSKAGGSGVLVAGRFVDPVGERWRAEGAGLFGEICGHGPGDEGVGAEGQMGAVLIEGSDRHDHSWGVGKHLLDLCPSQVVEGVGW